MLWTPIVSCDRRSADSAKTTETPAGLSETTRQDKVAVTVSVDRQRVRVAEPLALTLEVQAPLQVEVQWPDTARVLSEGFLVDDEGPVETQEGPQGRTWRQRLVIESNRSGQRQVPALTFKYGDKEIATAELPVEVISAIEADGSVDPTQFADIEGPVAVPRPTNYWALGCVAGAVLAVAGLGWYLLARRSARAAEVVPPPPPHVWALGQLDALLVEQLVQRGQVQTFFYRLSDIVRTYIELRFGLMAPEQTTDEFLADVQRSDALRFGHKDMLRAFLTACDLVKFARHEPAGAEIDGSIDAARRFIRETIPVGSAPDGAPAGDSS
ncbi:MAG: hypothetical protein ACE5GE_05645, partial [Phycisphaerae bacterium]